MQVSGTALGNVDKLTSRGCKGRVADYEDRTITYKRIEDQFLINSMSRVRSHGVCLLHSNPLYSHRIAKRISLKVVTHLQVNIKERKREREGDMRVKEYKRRQDTKGCCGERHGCYVTLKRSNDPIPFIVCLG